MGWTVGCWIAGIIAIVGPLCLIFWYVGAVKARLKEFHEKKE